MSISAMNWAWTQTLPPTKKLILMALADHSDDNGIAWPGQQGIAVKCGVSTRTVVRAISEFVDMGLLNIIRRGSNTGEGGRVPNLYQLCIKNKLSDNLSHKGLSDKSGGLSDTHVHLTTKEPSIINNNIPKKSTKFKKPTIQQIQDYITEKDLNICPERFFNHYESNGWLVGKNKMKNWQAACNTWQKNREKYNAENKREYRKNSSKQFDAAEYILDGINEDIKTGVW